MKKILLWRLNIWTKVAHKAFLEKHLKASWRRQLKLTWIKIHKYQKLNTNYEHSSWSKEVVIKLTENKARADLILTEVFFQTHSNWRKNIWNEHTMRSWTRQLNGICKQFKHRTKNKGKKLEACARMLDTCQYSGNYLDNRGVRINLKTRRNFIWFAYQVCNSAGLQN